MHDQTGPRRWRWWMLVLYGLIAAWFATMVVSVVLVSLRQPGEADAGGAFLARSASFLLLAIVLWGCWVWPFMRSGEPMVNDRVTPPAHLRSLIISTWIPAVLVVLAGFFTGFSVEVRPDGQARSSWAAQDVRHYVISAAIAAGCVAVAIVLRPVMRRRMERALRARSICPGCGYNLSGNRDAPDCPECGRATGDAA